MQHSTLGTITMDTGAMVTREIRRTLRSVDSLIAAMVIPVMILLVFTVIFGGALEESGGDYIDYVVPGILILCAGYGAASTAVSVATDMKSGTIDRFKTMPIFAPSVLIGHVLASMVRNLAASALVLLVAVALGFRADASPVDWLAALGILALFIFAMTWVACAIGLLLSPDAAQATTTIMLFLPYLSSGFVLTTTMPDWLGAFSAHQPLTPMMEAIRDLLWGDPVGNDAWLAIGWSLGIGLAGYLLAATLYRRRTAA